MTKKSISFQKALEDFDKSIDALEKEDLNIDDAIKIYEEGISKYEKCIELLDDANQKIELIKE